MSKKFKILIVILSLSLSFSLIYLYITNKYVVNQINANMNLREKALQIDEFKSNITDMSSMADYYMITKNESYKEAYDRNFNSVVNNVNELYDSNYITKEDKISLEDRLNKYNYLINECIFTKKDEACILTDNNSHNKYMKEEWIESKESLNSIEQDLLDLKNQLNYLMNKSDIPYERINVLENKLLKIRFKLEKLPEYHEFIMKLTEKY